MLVSRRTFQDSGGWQNVATDPILAEGCKNPTKDRTTAKKRVTCRTLLEQVMSRPLQEAGGD